MKKGIFAVLIITVVLLMFSGCIIQINSTEGTTWTFDNDSAHSLVVEVKNGCPSTLYLLPWCKLQSVVQEDDVRYTYNNFFVYDEEIEDRNTVKFYSY